VSQKTGPFSPNFRKYCLISIILSLLQTKIICPQKRNFSYSSLVHSLDFGSSIKN